MLSYHVIEIEPDGNCLFRAISYALHGVQDNHADIRLQVVTNVIQNWDEFKDFIIGDESYGKSISNAPEYQEVLGADGEYGGHVELTVISKIFGISIAVYRIDDLNNPQVYGSYKKTFNLLFSGEVDAGHYDVLIFDKLIPSKG